jgi:hypothetical protein
MTKAYQLLKFEDALSFMREGKKVSRATGLYSHVYLFMRDGKLFMVAGGEEHPVNILESYHILATDWRVVED